MNQPYSILRLRVWYVLWASFLVGILGGKALFGDYVVDRYSGSLVNSSPVSVTKRVSTYAAVSSGGDEYLQADPLAYNRYVFTLNTAGMRLAMKIGSSYSWVSAPIVITRVPPSNYMTGNTPAVALPEEYVVSGSNALRWMYKDTTYSGFPDVIDSTYWNTTGNHLNNGVTTSTPATSTQVTEETFTRGSLLFQREFELLPNSSMALNLEHDGPFFVVIEELKQFVTPDGGGGFAWEEQEEHTSTEHTEVSEETEHEPEITVGGNVPDYDSGPEPEAETRHETVDTLQKADDNSESRHTETKGWLAKISAGVDAAVNAISGLSGGGKEWEENADAPDDVAEAEAESLKDQVSGAVNAMDDVYQKTLDIVDSISMALPSGEPEFRIEFTWKGEDVVIESTPAQDSFMAIVRAMLAALITFGALMALIGIFRNALAS
jgi:hypothetical protein